MYVDPFVKALLNKVPNVNTLNWPFTSEINMTNTTDGVRITHCIGGKNSGGVTLAWRKASDTKNARMVEVAVAYCSPYDTFSKKIGTAHALDAFEAGETVRVPARTEHSDDTIPYNLRSMFWYSINH